MTTLPTAPVIPRMLRIALCVSASMLFAAGSGAALELQATPQAVTDAQPASASQRAAAALPALRDSVTLAQWLQAHPGDSVRPFNRRLVYAYAPDNWCAMTEAYLPDNAGGREWRRAYFYTPATTLPAVLPPDAPPHTFFEQCRLGQVLLGFGRAEAVARNDWSAPPLNRLAAAHDDAKDERSGWLQLQRTLRLEEAFSLAAVAGEPTAELRGMLRSTAAAGDRQSVLLDLLLGDATPLSTAAADTVAAALGSWLKGADTLPPSRRAAALLVADRLVDAVWPRAAYNFPQKVSPHGAQFEVTTRYPGYTYTRNLLATARDLNAPGRGGELAFLTSLVEGADQDSGCYRPIIKRGEQYLRENPTSSIRAEVHFMVAEAYADIVTIAAGGTAYRQLDSVYFRARAPNARVRAIEEFRAGMALAGPAAPRSRLVWQTAYRLMAGVPPLQTFWLCESDQ